MTFEELEEIISKYMLLEDKGIVKLLCAFIIAARLPINAPWLFIVSSSSGGKSMLLKALEGCEGVQPLDDLTSNTFISGMKGRDGESNSLLDAVGVNAILLFKDFTTILSKAQESKSDIIGQLRKIYDGDFTKGTGNKGGLPSSWEGKVTVLAGTTTSIYTSMHQFAAMGERFIMYHMNQPDREAMGDMATRTMDEREASAAMKDAFTKFLSEIDVPDKVPTIPEEIRHDIVQLSEMTTRARSVVERDWRDREKRIIQVHDLEMPARFAKQIIAIAFGMMVINGSDNLMQLDRNIISSMALDSITFMRRACMRMLTKYEVVQTGGLAVRLALPPDSIRMHLQDLAALGVLNYTKGSGNKDQWELKEHYRDLMARFDHIETTNVALTEDNAEEAVPGIDPVTAEDVAKSLEDEVQNALDIFGGEVVEDASASTLLAPL